MQYFSYINKHSLSHMVITLTQRGETNVCTTALYSEIPTFTSHNTFVNQISINTFTSDKPCDHISHNSTCIPNSSHTDDATNYEGKSELNTFWNPQKHFTFWCFLSFLAALLFLSSSLFLITGTKTVSVWQWDFIVCINYKSHQICSESCCSLDWRL